MPIEFYEEAVFELELIVNGRTKTKVGEFGPIINNQEVRENIGKSLMYLLQIFGPDTFLNFMLEYKCLE